MNKATKFLLGALLLAAVASAAFLLLKPEEPSRPVARITLNGTLVGEIDLTLDAAALPHPFTYEGPGGFTNTVEFEPGRVRVSEAGCPDQVCVNQGWISDGTTPIVCLPNKLIIEIVGGGDSLDAATG